VPGLAVAERADAGQVVAVCAAQHELAAPLASSDGPGLVFETTLVDGDLAGQRYRWEGSLTDTGVNVVEALPDRSGPRTLLIPYLRDAGSGATTVVSFLNSGVRFTLQDEWVECSVEGELVRRTDLPYGYESRRGLCGLVRLDLAEPSDTLRWSVVSSE
jgi:hypothetical protein